MPSRNPRWICSRRMRQVVAGSVRPLDVDDQETVGFSFFARFGRRTLPVGRSEPPWASKPPGLGGSVPCVCFLPFRPAEGG